MTGLRGICLMTGLVFFTLFFVPVLTYRVLNIGNATGMAVGLLLIFYAVFAGWFHRLVRASRFCRVILYIFGVFAAVGIAVAVWISICILRASWTVPKGGEPLIVLGCQVKGTRPSLMLTERLEAAQQYLDKYSDAKCILSGGQGNGEEISEAACMQQYLIQHGIAADRLLLEDQSTSTRENIRYSLQLMEANELGTSSAIATNEFHEYRAFLIAKKLGLTASAVPAKTHWWLLPTYWVREWYGIIYEWLGLGN